MRFGPRNNFNPSLPEAVLGEYEDRVSGISYSTPQDKDIGICQNGHILQTYSLSPADEATLW